MSSDHSGTPDETFVLSLFNVKIYRLYVGVDGSETIVADFSLYLFSGDISDEMKTTF